MKKIILLFIFMSMFWSFTVIDTSNNISAQSDGEGCNNSTIVGTVQVNGTVSLELDRNQVLKFSLQVLDNTTNKELESGSFSTYISLSHNESEVVSAVNQTSISYTQDHNGTRDYSISFQVDSLNASKVLQVVTQCQIQSSFTVTSAFIPIIGSGDNEVDSVENTIDKINRLYQQLGETLLEVNRLILISLSFILEFGLIIVFLKLRPSGFEEEENTTDENQNHIQEESRNAFLVIAINIGSSLLSILYAITLVVNGFILFLGLLDEIPDFDDYSLLLAGAYIMLFFAYLTYTGLTRRYVNYLDNSNLKLDQIKSTFLFIIFQTALLSVIGMMISDDAFIVYDQWEYIQAVFWVFAGLTVSLFVLVVDYSSSELPSFPAEKAFSGFLLVISLISILPTILITDLKQETFDNLYSAFIELYIVNIAIYAGICVFYLMRGMFSLILNWKDQRLKEFRSSFWPGKLLLSLSVTMAILTLVVKSLLQINPEFAVNFTNYLENPGILSDLIDFIMIISLVIFMSSIALDLNKILIIHLNMLPSLWKKVPAILGVLVLSLFTYLLGLGYFLESGQTPIIDVMTMTFIAVIFVLIFQGKSFFDLTVKSRKAKIWFICSIIVVVLSGPFVFSMSLGYLNNNSSVVVIYQPLLLLFSYLLWFRFREEAKKFNINELSSLIESNDNQLFLLKLALMLREGEMSLEELSEVFLKINQQWDESTDQALSLLDTITSDLKEDPKRLFNMTKEILGKLDKLQLTEDNVQKIQSQLLIGFDNYLHNSKLSGSTIFATTYELLLKLVCEEQLSADFRLYKEERLKRENAGRSNPFPSLRVQLHHLHDYINRNNDSELKNLFKANRTFRNSVVHTKAQVLEPNFDFQDNVKSLFNGLIKALDLMLEVWEIWRYNGGGQDN